MGAATWHELHESCESRPGCAGIHPSRGKCRGITVDIRKVGGSQWGAEWVRYVVGHPHTEPEPVEVAIALPHGPEMVSRSEVFTADEAADLFFTYYKTGDIPTTYALRPVEGFTKDGRNLDLRDEASSTF